VLPDYYLLENTEQWYPPGFSIFLSLIPDWLLYRFYWCVTPVLDTCIALLIFFAGIAAGYEITMVFAAGCIYIFSPASIRETESLTSRQLGALLLAITVSGAVLFLTSNSRLGLALFLVSGFFTLMTHKMSTQGLFAGLLLLTFVTGSMKPVLMLITLCTITVLFSRGYYLKILRSNIDFLTFWKKNWPYLGSHQILDSPVYRREGHTFRGTYRGGTKKHIQNIQEYIFQNLYAGIALLIIWSRLRGVTDVPEYVFWPAVWTVSVLLFGLLTYIVPLLRGAGYMLQYGKMALPFGVWCSAYALTTTVFTLPALLITSIIILKYGVYEFFQLIYTGIPQNITQWDLTRLKPLFDYLKACNNPIVLSIPNNYNDLLVYHCRIHTLWGSHGSPLDKIGDILPVFRYPVGEVAQKYGATHILVDTRYINPEILDLKYKIDWKNEVLILFSTQKEEQ